MDYEPVLGRESRYLGEKGLWKNFRGIKVTEGVWMR